MLKNNCKRFKKNVKTFNMFKIKDIVKLRLLVFKHQFLFVSCYVLLVFSWLQLSNAQSQLNNGQFSCQGRASGYYADVKSGCQIYHMCDTLGRQFSYSCPNTTLFQQRMLICDHWYMVNCSKSEVDYDANLLIGQKEKPFVEDDEEHPYHRTPRPDLLAHPSASEYNIVYRTGRDQASNQQNLIGGVSDPRDQPYFLPSHWSTDYRKPTQRPTLQKEQRTKKPYYSKSDLPEQSSDEPVQVNFKSTFKATTPVYPNIAPAEIPLLEEEYTHQNKPRVVLVAPPVDRLDKPNYGLPSTEAPPSFGTEEIKVNFASNFKATTPVYPTFVTPEEPLAHVDLPPIPNLPYGLSSIVEPPKNINDLEFVSTSTFKRQPILGASEPESSSESIVVNFKSSFKATTPVYPKTVTSENPLAIEEIKVDPNRPNLSTVIQSPRGYSQTAENTFIEPSIFFQPPATSNGNRYTKKDENEIQEHLESRHPAINPNDARVVIANLNWKELRRALFIPEVQFPLDASARRPTYDQQGPSSFQVQPVSSVNTRSVNGASYEYDLRQRNHAANK